MESFYMIKVDELHPLIKNLRTYNMFMQKLHHPLVKEQPHKIPQSILSHVIGSTDILVQHGSSVKQSTQYKAMNERVSWDNHFVTLELYRTKLEEKEQQETKENKQQQQQPQYKGVDSIGAIISIRKISKQCRHRLWSGARYEK